MADYRIAELGAREQRCCSFFEFRLGIATGGRVTLRVRAPQDGRAILLGLFGRDLAGVAAPVGQAL